MLINFVLFNFFFWWFFFSRVHLLPYGTDLLRLIFKEGGEDVKEPVRIVYKDVESSKVDSWNLNGNLFQYKEKVYLKETVSLSSVITCLECILFHHSFH